MSKKGKSLGNRIVSLMLAVAMVISTFVVASPIEVEAATKTKNFNGSKASSTVTIKDSEYRGNTFYLKYKPNKTGYVTLTFKSDTMESRVNSYGYVTLCNKSKKAIGYREVWDTYYGVASTKTYGVKKNQTYYFKVQCNGGAKITAKTTSVTKSTGNTKAKAKALTKSKTAKGIMIANENKADWYKINLTKDSKLRIKFTAKTNGLTGSTDAYGLLPTTAQAKAGIKVTFYDKNGKKWSSDSSTNLTLAVTENGWDIYRTNIYTGARSGIPKGTYWVKFERMNKYSSGYYTVKWSTF